MHDEFWDDLKACKQKKFDSDRASFLAGAMAQDDGNWTKHTPTR